MTLCNDTLINKISSREAPTHKLGIHVLKKAEDDRDCTIETHFMRINSLLTDLASSLDLTEKQLNKLRLLAQYHDIGKVAIPDCILFKPGPLSPAETLEMQRHCEIGYRIAQFVPDLNSIANEILGHHEWWNGNGYPQGLQGENIPLGCRLLAIIDAYDAMTSDRPYRAAIPREDAMAELISFAGIQFDPYLVEKFILIKKI